jgi:glycosyltransferase involved in cell wall biosynthesis
MLIEKLRDIPTQPSLAVIINVNTKIFTTLALLSTLKYTTYPVLLIDCKSTDGSFDHFIKLQHREKFFIFSTKLRPHGEMLDYLFSNLYHIDNILLIDSDIEILNSELFLAMDDKIKSGDIGGCGFLHLEGWLNCINAPYGWYVEKLYTPFVLLTSSVIKVALDSKKSFMHRRTANDMPFLPFLQWVLMYRYRVPFLKNLRLDILKPFRKEYFGHKPSFIHYDTGADIYQLLFKSSLYKFYIFPWSLHEKSLIHFDGITRGKNNLFDFHATPYTKVQTYVIEQLRNKYKIEMDGTEN